MKKFYSAAVTVAVAALALTACGGPASSTAQPSGSSPTFGDCKVTGQPGSLKVKTQTPDTLTVATVLPNPGWWNGTTPTSIKDGFEYCLAADLAYRAGLKSVQVKNLAWDQYISGTATGYDIGLAATTITDKRKQVLDFSGPYFSSNLGVATKADSSLSQDGIRDAKIGVLQGNIGAQWVADTLKPSKTTATFQSQADMFTALSAGQVDAVVTDTTLALTSVKASNGTLTVKGQYNLDQGYGVVLPHGSENTPAVTKVIGDMDSDGTLKDLSAQYLKPMFGIDPNEVPIWSAK
ncbi:ABC transporter substrate-binding protein [Paenarthrobacter sp. NPDC089675]|uniref:ABC transporter substrate-binding protein n=1 Tax=Paenarthrobacter TaxID=1742992 RepID=UPI0038285272